MDKQEKIERLKQQKEKYNAVFEAAKNMFNAIIDIQIDSLKNNHLPNYKNGCFENKEIKTDVCGSRYLPRLDDNSIEKNSCRCKRIINTELCKVTTIYECELCNKNKTIEIPKYVNVKENGVWEITLKENIKENDIICLEKDAVYIKRKA